MRYAVVICAIASLTSAAQAAESGDKYPTRPVRVITGSTGSTSDQIARFTAQKLTENLGQQFIVDNRAGAGGTIGTDIVAKSVPDGYTLIIAHAGTHVSAVSLFKNLPYDPVKDFAPVSLLMKGVTVLVAHPSVPANNVQELIALGKAKGGNAVAWGSAGAGTISHLAGELFVRVTGIDFLHVPYKGAGPALTGLLSGETNFAFLSPVTARTQLQAKKVKAFTVTSLQRFPGLPDVPSAAEAGVPKLDALLWFGLMAPAKTPQSIVMKLNREITESFNQPDTKEALLKLGAIAAPTTPQDMSAFIKAELAKWTPVIKAAGIKAE
ncbi:MAG TPA: tripartite tricarboxylate transporter substrate binding protein [Burkholderiales bacterium]|nr:tripartite tricarboxylate transporter substrate binding protein [Burkholderiales bacterium]